MSMTDPVADFLTRVRNGLHAQRQDVHIPASGLKRELARILADEGYITSYEESPPARPVRAVRSGSRSNTPATACP